MKISSMSQYRVPKFELAPLRCVFFSALVENPLVLFWVDFLKVGFSVFITGSYCIVRD